MKCPHCGKPLEHTTLKGLYFGKEYFLSGWGCYREGGCHNYLILDDHLNEGMLTALHRLHWQYGSQRTVEYFWLDELVEDIRLGENGLEVSWKNGRTTSAEFEFTNALQNPVKAAGQYNRYLEKVRNGQNKPNKKIVMGL